MDKDELIAALRDWYGIDVPALQAQAAQPATGLAAEIAEGLRDAGVGVVALTAEQVAQVGEALRIAGW